MKKYFLFTMIFIFSAIASASLAAEALTGRLEKRWSYGAPNYGETPEQDAKEFYDVLVLDTPQYFILDGENIELKEVQLLFYKSVYYPFSADSKSVFENKKYTMSGKLQRAETGHHHLDFILLVEQYKLNEENDGKPKYRIDGKSYNKQIFDDKNNQITNFANWELIQDFYVSPDETKMLVYHRPDKAKAFLITLYNLQTKKIIAEVEPGWGCYGIQWTKDYLIYIWRTSGGGVRYEYRDYETLAIEKVVQSYLFFQDLEENLLIDIKYFTAGLRDGIIAYNYSDGTKLKSIKIIDDLYKMVWASDEPRIKAIKGTGKGISVNCDCIYDFHKTGKRKYQFKLDYYFCIEGEEEFEDRTTEMEIDFN